MEDKQTLGSLTVTVLKARLTHDTESFGKMDPYVRIQIGKAEQKTVVKQDAGKNPEWNETFEFGARNGELLDVSIWDKEDVTKDDFVGGTKIMVDESVMKVKEAKWYPIFFGDKKQERGGEVLLEILFNTKHENVMLTMLQGRQVELGQVQNNLKSAREEVSLFRDKVTALTKENEQLRAQYNEEKQRLIKSYEAQKEGQEKEHNHQVELINEISSLKEATRALQADKAALVKNEEKLTQRIKELESSNAALEALLKPKFSPKGLFKDGGLTTLGIFGIFLVGSLLHKK